MNWDDAIYFLITVVVAVFIAWLLLVPAPGHDPLVVFHHTALVRG